MDNNVKPANEYQAIIVEDPSQVCGGRRTRVALREGTNTTVQMERYNPGLSVDGHRLRPPQDITLKVARLAAPVADRRLERAMQKLKKAEANYNAIVQLQVAISGALESLEYKEKEAEAEEAKAQEMSKRIDGVIARMNISISPDDVMRDIISAALEADDELSLSRAS